MNPPSNIINQKPSTPYSNQNPSGVNNNNNFKPSSHDPSSAYIKPQQPSNSKPTSLSNKDQKIVMAPWGNAGNNNYPNYGINNNNILQRPNILSSNKQAANPQIVRSDNRVPLSKPSNYDNKNIIIKPTNNYNNPVVNPKSNYDNKNPVIRPNNNYQYNFGGNVQPSNQAGQNRFLQAVRPSSGVNKVVKR